MEASKYGNLVQRKKQEHSKQSTHSPVLNLVSMDKEFTQEELTTRSEFLMSKRESNKKSSKDMWILSVDSPSALMELIFLVHPLTKLLKFGML